MDETIINQLVKYIKEINIKIRDKRFKLGDRIFCKSWRGLLVTALTLSSAGYGVNVIGLRGISGDILTITALPEKKEQIPDIRVTAEEAGEAIQNLTKAGISQEDIESSDLPLYDPDISLPE